MQQAQTRTRWRRSTSHPPGKSPIFFFFTLIKESERLSLSSVCLLCFVICGASDESEARVGKCETSDSGWCAIAKRQWCGKSLLTHHSVDYRHYHQQHTRAAHNAAPHIVRLCKLHARTQAAGKCALRSFHFSFCINRELRRTHRGAGLIIWANLQIDDTLISEKAPLIVEFCLNRTLQGRTENIVCPKFVSFCVLSLNTWQTCIMSRIFMENYIRKWKLKLNQVKSKKYW